jgi:N4-gp56 family major capsid protein
MPDTYETGAIFSGALPAGQRTFYEQLLLENLRTKSILVPYTVMKEDFSGRDTGRITYSEVMDTDPNFEGHSEDTLWLPGAHLDSRSVTIDLAIHGDIIKVSDYTELVNFWNKGDLRSLVNGKLGQNQVDYLDLLARNAFLEAPYKQFGGGKSDRASLTKDDIFDPDMLEETRTLLEERNVPGVQSVETSGLQTLVCVTTPRVINQIRTKSTKWVEVNQYQHAAKIFNGEVGTWGGVRFVKTNRLWLRNYGALVAQATLDGPTVAGEGAAALVDKVYTPGQGGNVKKYITVKEDPTTLFKVGEWVTIHKATAPGLSPVETDGSLETRRIESMDKDNKRIAFDRPLLKPHADSDFVSYGLDVHASIILGGPGVVYGVGERPHVLTLPVIDDMAMIRRYGWRGFVKMQLFRPEMFQVIESAGIPTQALPA